MKLTKKAIKTAAKTKLEKAVAHWLVEKTEDGDDIETTLEDLLQYGCQSGMVNDLIYYRDTTAFYRRHQKDINALLYDLIESTGSDIRGLFGDKWNKEDPLALEDLNQNYLAWFGFEESARNLASKLGLEI